MHGSRWKPVILLQSWPDKWDMSSMLAAWLLTIPRCNPRGRHGHKARPPPAWKPRSPLSSTGTSSVLPRRGRTPRPTLSPVHPASAHPGRCGHARNGTPGSHNSSPRNELKPRAVSAPPASLGLLLELLLLSLLSLTFMMHCCFSKSLGHLHELHTAAFQPHPCQSPSKEQDA